MKAKVNETVRIFFGVGGPNFTSSFHVIGEIFDRVYDQASLTSPPLINVQITLVPAGGATIVEFKLDVPGRYILVDHALSRLERDWSASYQSKAKKDWKYLTRSPTAKITEDTKKWLDENQAYAY